MFSSGAENRHKVDEILEGHRYTLTLWFSLDSSCNGDAQYLDYVVSHIGQSCETTTPSKTDAQHDEAKQKSEEGTLIENKLQSLELAVAAGFTEASSPILVQSANVILPHAFTSLREALDLAAFSMWRHG